MLWNALRQEVMGTVDDFRQKGAIGALRDAALDARDMATGAGSALIDGVQGLVAGDDSEQQAAVRSEAVPVRGATVPLEFMDGRVLQAVVVDIDGVSEPPRARVTVEGIDEPLLVPILAPGVPLANGEGSSARAPRTSFIDVVKAECQATVQEFREKGAVGALKDATFDAVDMVGSAAKTVASTTQNATSEVVQEFREKGAVGALKDATMDAVDIVGNAASGAVDLLTPQTEEETPAEGAEQAADAPADGRRASLLDGLKDEWDATVKDFREKGAVGAIKDATLDAVDIVGSTAKSAASGAMSLASPLIDFDTPAEGATEGNAGAGNGILDGLKQELNATVQDFKEKGAIGAMKDATIDAAGLVGGAATAVVGKAQEIAARGWEGSRDRLRLRSLQGAGRRGDRGRSSSGLILFLFLSSSSCWGDRGSGRRRCRWRSCRQRQQCQQCQQRHSGCATELRAARPSGDDEGEASGVRPAGSGGGLIGGGSVIFGRGAGHSEGPGEPEGPGGDAAERRRRCLRQRRTVLEHTPQVLGGDAPQHVREA